MRKTYVAIFFLFLFIPCTVSAEFWASKTSDKYHYPDCKWAQRIKSENLIRFETPEVATKAGYAPCKMCKPPLSSESESETTVEHD